MRKFHIVRIRLADGTRGIFLGPADVTRHGVEDIADENPGCVSDPLVLECDDQMPIRDLWLLSKEPGTLQ